MLMSPIYDILRDVWSEPSGPNFKDFELRPLSGLGLADFGLVWRWPATGHRVMASVYWSNDSCRWQCLVYIYCISVDGIAKK
jgi:hypothetical protein